MDQAQARALLASERARLQRLLQAAAGEPQAAELGDEVDDAGRRNARAIRRAAGLVKPLPPTGRPGRRGRAASTAAASSTPAT
jgi:hypothetical protein